MSPGMEKVRKLSKGAEKEIITLFTRQFSRASTLLADIPRPKLPDQNESEGKENATKKMKKVLPKRLCPALGGDKKPARTVEELQAKLALLKGKPKLAYKEKLVKKGLKDRLRKRERKDKRKKENALLKQEKLNKDNKDKKNIPKIAKPVFNQEGKMIFSKFDFSETNPEKKVSIVKDPAVALRKINEEKEKLKSLEKAGEGEKAKELQEKKAWKNAILKSEGFKIKTDPELLKKSIKREKYKKQKSLDKWKNREMRIKKEQVEKQKKRLENIQARARQKKVGKMKKAAKKGRVIAGF